MILLRSKVLTNKNFKNIYLPCWWEPTEYTWAWMYKVFCHWVMPCATVYPVLCPPHCDNSRVCHLHYIQRLLRYGPCLHFCISLFIQTLTLKHRKKYFLNTSKQFKKVLPYFVNHRAWFLKAVISWVIKTRSGTDLFRNIVDTLGI